MVAVQREFANGGAEFPTGDEFTRIAVYDLHRLDTRAETNALWNGLRCGGDWKFYFYRVDFNDSDSWAGLSEVISIGTNEYAVVERDSEIGTASELKKIYAFSLADLEPDSDGIPSGDDNDTVNKALVLNVLEESFPHEKVESLALTPDNDLWVGLDNDGGEMESRLINTARSRTHWTSNWFLGLRVKAAHLQIGWAAIHRALSHWPYSMPIPTSPLLLPCSCEAI